MTDSSFYSVNLIRAIERNEPIEAWKIFSEVENNEEIDLSSTVGGLRVTALQYATWRGWLNLSVALRERGADVNVSDKLGRCPLHYAAHQGNVQLTEWLVQSGATLDTPVEINSCTRDQPLRSSETNENHPSPLNIVIGKNLPLPECWGRTPLHQAVRNNHPEVVRILASAGARIDAKDERGVTPLLLAGSNVNSDDSEEMKKFAQVVNILVSSNASTNIIHPDTGSSALHHAASLGSAAATRRLLEGGAWPLFQCSSTGSTALHIAASAGNFETLSALLEAVNSENIDIQDQVGRTPLHRAAYQGHRNCIELLVDYGGNLAAETKTGVSVIDAIFAHTPRPLIFITQLLDSRVRPNGNCCAEKASYMNVDFGILAPTGQLQMAVVSCLIGAASNIEQLGILQHPLVESFLSLKWSRLRGFFFLLVLVHLFFVLSLSGYAIVLLRHKEDFTLPRYVLMVCSWILLFHNMIQVFMVPRYYLRQFETWSSLICAVISLATSTLAVDKIHENIDQVDKISEKRLESSQWIFHSISIAILFAWIQMMLLIGRFPTYGYYALMFSTVLKNILKVLLAFICLIVGFALSFSVLFHGNDQFRDSWRALVKTVVMMMGEYEYGDLFDDEDDDNDERTFSREFQPNQLVNLSSSLTTTNSTPGDDEIMGEKNFLHVTSRIVFLGFIVLASIVLMNLMIGLAVNDIQGLEKEGHIRRLLKQAEFVAHLERVISHRIFRSKWLHSRLRILADSRRIIATKMTIGCVEKYPHQSHDISPELLEALFTLATMKSEKNEGIRGKFDDKNLMTALMNLEQLLRQFQCTESDVASKFKTSFVKKKVAKRMTINYFTDRAERRNLLNLSLPVVYPRTHLTLSQKFCINTLNNARDTNSSTPVKY